MKKYLKAWSGSVAVVFLLASCAPAAHIEKDDTVNFNQYKTFAWVDQDGKGKKDGNRGNEFLEQKVREAVNQELISTAGWKESDTNPDILLSFDVLVERSSKSQSDAVYTRPFIRSFYNPYSRRAFNVYYPSRFMGYDSYNVPTREGTVTITMTDARSDKAVWQGWATNEIDSRNMTGREIQSGIRKIFRKFDIAKN